MKGVETCSPVKVSSSERSSKHQCPAMKGVETDGGDEGGQRLARKHQCPAMKGVETSLLAVTPAKAGVSKHQCPAMKGVETRAVPPLAVPLWFL